MGAHKSINVGDGHRLAVKMRELMAELDIDIYTVATRSSMDAKTIQGYVNGSVHNNGNIALYTAVGIADALRVDPMQFLSDIEGQATMVRQSAIDAARETVAGRIVRKNKGLVTSVIPMPLEGNPNPEEVDVLAERIAAISGGITVVVEAETTDEVPTHLELMQLIKKIRNPEDLMMIREFITDINNYNKSN